MIASFCFVRSAVDADGGQIVVIDDPASHPGKDMHVAYDDGHVGLVRDLRIWVVACRLAASAQASGPGIGIRDWPEDLTADGQYPPLPRPATDQPPASH